MNQEKMIKWYDSSLKCYGEDDFRSLTWGDKEGKSAKLRYQMMDNLVNFKNKDIIEFGCGWGSFFDFGFNCKSYQGVDINNKLIKIASKKYPKYNFKTHDVSTYKDKNVYDISIASGVAGNMGGPADHPTKVRQLLLNMYNHSKIVMINFPSIFSTIRSNNIEYFSPSSTLEIALSISENVQLIHKSKFDFLLILK